MTNELENLNSGMQRTRRNVMKIGAILVPATLARVSPAAAGGQGGNGQGGNGQGGNGQGGNGQGGSSCFLKGTNIKTADGERRIEDLAIGDLLPTVFGGLRPVQWIGRYPFRKSDPSKPWVKDAVPVRIARSALAPNVPEKDLLVTSGHALFLNGLLIQVENLINGATIARYEARQYDELEYFNIKLDGHDVIYAEGAPVETMLSVDEAAANFAGYCRLYGAPDPDASRCAPLVTYGGGRGEFKSRIRSAISPWLDRREPIDAIRDRLEERAVALSRQPDLVV